MVPVDVVGVTSALIGMATPGVPVAAMVRVTFEPVALTTVVFTSLLDATAFSSGTYVALIVKF